MYEVETDLHANLIAQMFAIMENVSNPNIANANLDTVDQTAQNVRSFKP